MKVINWDRFQHYKERRPPWIKLHRQLLDSRQWFSLSDGASRLLVECWLIASESSDGTLTDDVDDLAFRLHKRPDVVAVTLQELVDKGFIKMRSQGASKLLASCTTETEGETEGEVLRVESKKAFEELWVIHRRGSKQEALKGYRKAVKNGVDHPTMIVALKAYVRNDVRADFKGQHLFRWIRDKRWEEFDGNGPTGALNRPILTGWEPPA